MTSTRSSQHVQVACCHTPLGYLWLAARNRTLLAAGLADHDVEARQQAEQAAGDQTSPADSALQTLATTMAHWLSDPSAPPPEARGWSLPSQGTTLQRAVWQQLQQIPVGHTLSYAELAERVGRPTATRAVASACAANPLAILVPCHRVIRRDGGLGGYRWGLARKQRLLHHEAQATHAAALAA